MALISVFSFIKFFLTIVNIFLTIVKTKFVFLKFY